MTKVKKQYIIINMNIKKTTQFLLNNPEINIPNGIEAYGTYGTIAKLTGECATCGYVLGFNFGNNAAHHPINCSFASYMPGHVKCPKCGTDYQASRIGNSNSLSKEFVHNAMVVIGLPKDYKKWDCGWHKKFIEITDKKLAKKTTEVNKLWGELQILIKQCGEDNCKFELDEFKIKGSYMTKDGMWCLIGSPLDSGFIAEFKKEAININ